MRVLRKRKVKCDKCGGKGWKFDHEDGCFSFGIDYIFQLAADKNSPQMKCKNCDGKGYVVETEEYDVIR